MAMKLNKTLDSKSTPTISQLRHVHTYMLFLIVCTQGPKALDGSLIGLNNLQLKLCFTAKIPKQSTTLLEVRYTKTQGWSEPTYLESATETHD